MRIRPANTAGTGYRLQVLRRHAARAVGLALLVAAAGMFSSCAFSISDLISLQLGDPGDSSPATMSALPHTTVSASEDPSKGRVHLTFTAAPAQGGPDVAYTEARIGRGEWQRGNELDVPRRGISTNVYYRSVDVNGAAEPERKWSKNWPGLRAVNYPEGTDNWVATYEWYRFPLGDWKLDHPTCLIFRSHDGESITLATVQRALGQLRFGTSQMQQLLRSMHLTTYGGLAFGKDGRPNVQDIKSSTVGLKRPLAPSAPHDFTHSFIHVRVYAPDGKAFTHPDHGSWVIGTCHLDVNELMSGDQGKLTFESQPPPGVPLPPDIDAYYLKYGGNSECAESRLADLWEEKYGADSVDRNAVPLGDPQNWFEVEQQGEFHGKAWVTGKWWHSDGRATVLTVPE